jgi:TP901 family phage tail tape measure protein
MIFDVEGLANVKRAADILDAMNKKQLALIGTQGKATAANKRVTSSITEQVGAHKRLQTTLSTTAAGTSRLTAKFIATGAAGAMAANKAGTAWIGLGRVIAGFAMYRGLTLITQGFRNAIVEAVKYEIAIGEIMSISHNAPLGFNRWSQGIRELSEAWKESAADVAEGVYQALSNQVAEGAEALSFMTEAMRLSTITVSTTTDAVQLLTGVMNSYHMSVDDAGYISNIFFKTVELGRLRLKDMANTMGRVNMLGAQMGVRFEETAAAVATLSRQGVQPTVTLTLLRAVMMKLIRPTDHMKEVFHSWGVTSAKAAIDAFGLVGVLAKIEEAAKGGGDEMQELGEMFGRIRAIVGAAGLIGNLKLFNSTLAELTDGAKDANQALLEITQTAGYKLQVEWNKLKNIFTHDIGQPLIQSLSNMNDAIGGFSNRLKDVLEIMKLVAIAAVALTAGFVVGRIAAVTAELYAFAKVGLAFQLIAEGMKVKWMAFIAKFGAIPLLFAAVATASYLMATAYFDSVERMTNVHLAMDEERVNSTKMAADEIGRLNREQIANTYRALIQAVENQKRVLLGVIADIQAAHNELQGVMTLQLSLEKAIFDLRFKNASETNKKRMLDKKMYEEYKTIRAHIEAGEDEAAAKMISRFEGTVSAIEGLIDGNNRYVPATGLRNRMAAAFEARLAASMGASGDQTTPGAQARMAANQTLIDGEREKVKAIDKYLVKLKEEDEAHKALATNIAQQTGELQANIQRMQATLSGWWTDFNFNAMITAELKKGDTRPAWKKFFLPMSEEMQLQGEAAMSGFLAFKKKIGELAEMPMDQFMAIPVETLEKDVNAMREIYRQFSQQLDETQKIKFETFFAWYRARLAEVEANKGGLRGMEGAIRGHADAIGDAQRSALILKENWKHIGDNWKNTAGGITRGIMAMQESTGTVSVLYTNVMHASANVLETARALNAETQRLNNETRALQAQTAAMKGGAFGGRFAAGGLASDFIPAMLRKGEYVTNPRATKNFLPDLVAMNNGARHAAGGNITNNIGDVNVTVQGGDTSERTARAIAQKLRRELRRGTSRLS